MLKHNLKTNRYTWLSDANRVQEILGNNDTDQTAIFDDDDTTVYYYINIEDYQSIPQSQVYNTSELVNAAFSMSTKYLTPMFINQYVTACMLKHVGNISALMLKSLTDLISRLSKEQITLGTYNSININTSFNRGAVYTLETNKGIKVYISVSPENITVGYLDENLTSYFVAYQLVPGGIYDEVGMFEGNIYIYEPLDAYGISNPQIDLKHKLTPAEYVFIASRLNIQ